MSVFVQLCNSCRFVSPCLCPCALDPRIREERVYHKRSMCHFGSLMVDGGCRVPKAAYENESERVVCRCNEGGNYCSYRYVGR